MRTLKYFLLLRKSIVGWDNFKEIILKKMFASDSAAVKTQTEYLTLLKKKKTKLKVFYAAAQNNGFKKRPLYWPSSLWKDIVKLPSVERRVKKISVTIQPQKERTERCDQ